MREPKFYPDQWVFCRHVLEDPIFTTRVIEYMKVKVCNSRYDEKSDTFHYKIFHPIHSDVLVEVPEYDLFNSYADAVKYDRFIK